METFFFKKNLQKSNQFLPYLWGMETEGDAQKHDTGTKFLPYLWGMETTIRVDCSIRCEFGSYRTYEEWKPHLVLLHSISRNSFLPYLWGMETPNVWVTLLTKFLGSYRTYEEWKLIP